VSEKQSPDQLDPLTEAFSLLELSSLEEEEKQGKVNYQALYDELAVLCGEFFEDPKTVRTGRKFLKIVVVMRFFGIYPEAHWKENQWRLSHVNLPETQKERLTRQNFGEYIFWQPPEERRRT